MSDPRSQRNLAVIVAVAAVAILIGFLIGRGGSNDAPAAPIAGAPAAAPADVPAVAGEVAEPTQVAEAAPVAEAPAARRSTTGPTVPVAGQRTRAPRAETPAAAPAADAVDPVEDLYAAADTADGPAAEEARPAAPVRVMTRVEIPEGTKIVLDLLGGVSSATAQVGDEVVAELAEPVRVNGRIILPVGTRATGRVTEAQALKTVGGQSILGLAFDHVDSGDGGADISAAFYREGKKETGKDAATIAGGAAAGAILGNQAKKNDRGKLIGAILGAAAGAAVASRTPGEVIELPDGARLELTLREPAHVLVERE